MRDTCSNVDLCNHFNNDFHPPIEIIKILIIIIIIIIISVGPRAIQSSKIPLHHGDKRGGWQFQIQMQQVQHLNGIIIIVIIIIIIIKRIMKTSYKKKFAKHSDLSTLMPDWPRIRVCKKFKILNMQQYFGTGFPRRFSREKFDI